MNLLRTVKGIIVDNIFEQRDAELRILKKTFASDVSKLYDYLNARGVVDDFMNDIMTDDDDESRELHRMIISSFLSSKDNERLYKYTLPAFSDLQIKDGKVILTLDDKSDLSKFFYSGRDYSKDTVHSILSGDVDFYNVDYVDNSSVENLIDDLNEDNLKELKSLMISKGLGKTVSYSGNDSHIDDMIESDDNVLTQDTLDYVFDSGSRIYELLSGCDVYEDLLGNIERIYRYSEEGVLNDEVYDSVYSAIENFFGKLGNEYDSGRKITKTRKDGSKYTYTDYDYDIDVTSIYIDVIKWWVDNDYEDLDYWGDFETMLEEYCDGLNYRDSLTVDLDNNYADYDKVIERANEMFLDYIDD